MRRELKARWQKLFQIDAVRATRQVIDFSAIQALKVMVVVQVRFFVERFAAWHLHRLYFACIEQCVYGAVYGCLANFGLAFLRERNEVCDRQRPVGIHDDIMDDRALAGLALADFHHAGITVRKADKSAIDIRLREVLRVGHSPKRKGESFKSTLRAVRRLEKTAVELTAHDLDEMKRIAARLAAEIKPPLLIKVTGHLGAGKTTLIAEILRNWGVAAATSPTFNLRNDYRIGASRAVHLDFYRLKPGDGGFDLLPVDEDYSDAVVFVEWPEKAAPAVFTAFENVADLAIRVSPDGTRHMLWQRE